ncbi:SH3 domain-containing protein [Rhodobacter sp.]
MFATLLIAGEDKGQLRPGLAAAVAAGQDIVVLERRRAPAAPVVKPAVAIAGAAPVVEPVVAEPVIEAASYTPPPAAAQGETPAPIFTLSSLPTATMDAVVDTPAPAAAPAAAASGDIWYVTAGSVNVRQGPSTDAAVVDKLSRGEAVSVSFEEGSEWAHVRIEGDGLEGYVALRFLSPTTP